VKPLPPAQHFPPSTKFIFSLPLISSLPISALNPVLLNKTFGEDKKITIKAKQGEDGRWLLSDRYRRF
jgi:hypothetical protein